MGCVTLEEKINAASVGRSAFATGMGMGMSCDIFWWVHGWVDGSIRGF